MGSAEPRNGDLPAGAFLAPTGRDEDEGVALLARAVRLVGELSASAPGPNPAPRPPRADPPTDVFEGAPLAADALLDELRSLCLDSIDLSHPGSMAHMDPPPTTASIVGDLVSSALNNNLLFRELSPAFTRLEKRLLRDLAGRFGLGQEGGGIMLPGGTLANLQALVMARNAAGMRSPPGTRKPWVVVASDAAHASIVKAAMVMGLETGAVRSVPTGPDGRLDPSRLAETVDSVAETRASICLVATAGTTVTGVIEPLPEIAEIARESGAWLHVDAAFGGALAFSPRYRGALRGIEAADSLTFNPQKGLAVARTSAMLLLRRERDLGRLFRIAAPYAGDEELERGEVSLQGTSRSDVLKLWLTLRHLGERGCASLIEGSMERARNLADRIGELPRVEIAAEPETPVVCFRSVPPEDAGRTVDGWNLGLRAHLLVRSGLSVSAPVWKGERWLRAVTTNPFSGPDPGRPLARGIESFYELGGPEGAG